MSDANQTNRSPELKNWNDVNWRRIDKSVKNLRQRIHRASRDGDAKKVKSLQKLMLRSFSNRLHSIRKVTQINVGKSSPGVDKVLVKTGPARLKLAVELSSGQPWRVQPVKRVFIPKTNGKLRPLGIPTIADRAMQAIVKNALEPEWEARFEPCSYGFRPGRSCHDAIGRIFNLARPDGRKKWVVDADIKGAFDNIRHETILDAVCNFPGYELIKQWLKAGCMEGGSFVASESGTPQGGVISPLLANIALHGLEQAIGVKYSRKVIKSKRALVRYADDFVIFVESEADAEQAKSEVSEWLRTRGLELSQEKTAIRHLRHGFDFLGFNVRQYKAPKTSRSGFKLLITPSKKSQSTFKRRLKAEWNRMKGHNVDLVVKTLNPVIRGWANYYRTVVAKHTFNQMDRWMFRRELRWIRFSHPNKPWGWMKRRYFGELKRNSRDRWVFGNVQTGAHLLKLEWTPIKRHALVPFDASPDDRGLQDYWQQRNKLKTGELSPRNKRAAIRQEGRCSLCGSSLWNEESLELHHWLPRSQGGSERDENLYLVHLYCHQQIHGTKYDAKRSA